MPAAVFGLSRAPTTKGTYGLPAAAAPILPTQFRQAVASQTLAALPLTGSVLIVCTTGNADTFANSISGGGVSSWTLISASAVGGANNTSFAAWWGVVGPTPSTLISALVAGGNTGSAVAEFTNLRGVSHAVKTGNGALAAIRATIAGGVLIHVAAGHLTLTLPGTLTTAITGNNGRSVAIQYSPAAFPTNTDAQLTLGDSGGKPNNCAIVLL